MPINEEFCLLFQTNFCKKHLRLLSRKNWLAVCNKALFKYTQFLKSRREIKSNQIFVSKPSKLNLNFKSHRNIRAAARKIFGLHKRIHSIDSACNSLKNFKRKPNC